MSRYQCAGTDLGNDDGHGKVLRVRGDVPEQHDAWQANVSAGVGDVVDHGGDAAGVDDQLRQLRME